MSQLSYDPFDDDDDRPQIHYWEVDDDGNVTDVEPPPDLGPCCACGRPGLTVRNIMCLDVRAPVPGTGWGCFVCGAPMDGAVAVLCDACLESDAEIRSVCHGRPGEGRRVALAACTEPFHHDMGKHPEVIDA